MKARKIDRVVSSKAKASIDIKAAFEAARAAGRENGRRSNM